MALTPRERAVADIVENAAREAFPQLLAAGLSAKQTIEALRKLLPKVRAAAEEALDQAEADLAVLDALAPTDTPH
jgi:hypothetical protein